MRSYVQVLTTPTADTPGTTLLLHFDNKRYLIGGLSEGTQRACVQMGARLLKVSECFITGRTEWRNTGGLIGMILTLADGAASSAAAGAEEAKKKAHAKGKRLGVSQDEARMKELEEEAKKETSARLQLFSAPNMNHTLATARRFVFRKGMPVDVHEIEESTGRLEGDEEWAPYWADENVKVWAMSVLPESSTNSVPGAVVPEVKMAGTVSPRKRSIDEVNDRHTNARLNDTTNPNVIASDLTPSARDQLTVKAVVGEMFNSSWRLDTLHETPLNEVRLPATIFIRNPSTNKLERYTGALPNQPLRPGQQPLENPGVIVLVRRPWPGALVESLPLTQPRKEAVSYIFRNHMQRGRFHPERAKELKVEKGFKWSQLQNGQSVQNSEGETITSEMVLGESKEGGGMAVVDLPTVEYIAPLLARPEWRAQKVTKGVGAVVWICGSGVAVDERLRGFMDGMKGVEHIVSSPELCANHIALDSAAAATVRLKQVDPKRYTVPIHENEPTETAAALPKNARIARRGQTIQLEPKLEVQDKPAIQLLDIRATESETSPEVLALASRAQKAIQSASPEHQKWLSTLPPSAAEAEIVTLGTGSALPSKYRNVSATLLRVPGWGSLLFDCGENTLGQLKRVFTAAELKEVLRELRIIFISHMHADHHLGTVSVIRAWYEEVHGAVPLPEGTDRKTSFDTKNGLAVVSEPAMLNWLAEYSAVEDYGFSRLAPLFVSAANNSRKEASELGWFVPPATLAALPSAEARMEMLGAHIVPPSILNLEDVQAVTVQHCHGARAVSITFPSGFKASYSGDCRPSKAFSLIGKGSTVVIHEATFDDELAGDALAKNHSTTSEALGVAQGMRARCVVLTHFSQRYQRVPVLDRGAGAGAGSEAPETYESINTEDADADADADDAPLEDGGTSNNDSTTALTGTKSAAPREAVKVKVASDMKVCVAFDYMRVEVGEIPELEYFTPALLKLFEEEDKEGKSGGGGGVGGGGDAVEDMKAVGKKGAKKGKKGQRGNV